jgi:hypothetical protein
MITSAIIDKFELYVDDGTELSSSEELDLAQKVYDAVCNNRPWEFLKKTHSATISGNAITLPTDFAYMTINGQSSDSSVAQETETEGKVIYVGTNLTPVRMVNFSDRRKHQNENVAYIDMADGKIKFITTQTDTSAEYDYIKIPPALTLATSPVFPERFHHIIFHGMAIDDYIIQQFDKARSYKDENTVAYNSILRDMAYWNSQFHV